MENVRIWKYPRRTQIDLTRKRLSKSPVVQFSGTVKNNIPKYGGVAQLGEHLPCKQGVMGSNPIISTRSESFTIMAKKMEEIHGKLNGLIAQQVRARA